MKNVAAGGAERDGDEQAENVNVRTRNLNVISCTRRKWMKKKRRNEIVGKENWESV